MTYPPLWLSKHFRFTEIGLCHSGILAPPKLLKNIVDLVTELELLRRVKNLPMSILSGFRDPAWNTKIGGMPHSQHLLGKAADIVIVGVSPGEVADMVEAGIAKGDFTFGGVGRYKTFTHVDIRTGHARWDFTND